jgi:hypothetical protein
MTNEKPTPEQYRRAMLDTSRDEIDKALRKFRAEDPWVIVADVGDVRGRQVAAFAELAPHWGPEGPGEDPHAVLTRLDDQAKRAPKGQAYMATLAVPGIIMPKVIGLIAPPSEDLVSQITAHRQDHPGTVPIMVVGAGGYTFSFIEPPK